MPTYPGYDELRSYIINTKKPSMIGFVTKYEAKLAQFSASTSITTPHGYFNYWKSMFVMQVCEFRPELALRPTKFCKKAWTKKLKELVQFRNTLQTSRIQGLKNLERSTEQAAKSLGNRSEEGDGEEDDGEEGDGEEDGEEAIAYEKLSDVDKLIQSFLHYTKGQTLHATEKLFVEQMVNKRETVTDRLLGVAAANILRQDWTYKTDIYTKLCLSNIVNFISPDSTEFLQEILTPDQLHSLEATDTPSLQGLSKECLDIFDELINDNTILDSDNIMQNIHKLQAKHCHNMKSDLYKMLGILQLVITQFSDWNTQMEESETTVYRRFAVLLDCLFRNTNVVMKDGECVAQTTKDTMIILQAIAGYISTGLPKTYGNKIDLLAATYLDGEQYDLCSNEWKRGGVCDSIMLKQQAKNIRTNATILSKLIKLGCADWMVAMDWGGVTGYAYTLSFKNGTFIAKKMTDLMIPQRSTQLKVFKNTLNFLFHWRNVLIRTAAKIDDQPNKAPLRGIVIATEDASAPKIPTIIITPTLGKRKIEDVEQDDDEQ